MDQNTNSNPAYNPNRGTEKKKDPGVSVRFTDIAPQQKKYVAEMPQSRSEKKSSSKWVIIVVVGLVALTVIGLIWLFGRGSSEEEKQSDQTSEQTQQTTEEETEEVVEEVDVSVKESDSGVEDLPTEDDFSTSTQTVGEEDVSDVVLGEMDQTGYEDFLRIVFTVDSDDLPYTTAELVSQSKMIRLKFTGISEDNSGIGVGKEAEVTGSVVSTIIHDATSEENSSRYSIGITEDTSFYLHTLEDPLRIVLDIKEIAEEEEDPSASSGQDEEDVEAPVSGENEFSKEAQAVDGDASGYVIVMNNVNYYDAPDEGVFRIVFTVGSLGSGSLPDAKAQIVDYEGGKAIKLEISDMQQDFAAEGDYDVTYGNYGVEGMKGSFASNTSTYYIILKTGERDYKLYKRDAPAQVIVDVKR